MEVAAKPINWDLRIARIEWTGPSATNVTAQSDPVSVTLIGKSRWHATFPTFPRVNGAMGQLAINAKALESAPVLMLADGTAIPMLRVPATDLWVENGAWLKERRKDQEKSPKWPRFRKASLNAKAGRVQIRIAQDILDLELSPADWSWNDVLHLELDLRATALELVLERKSAATATQETQRLTGSLEKLKAALTAFAEQSERISLSPMRELRSNVVLVRAHRAKPYPGGLIDLTRRPGASYVRSRVSQESIDCPENRYIAFLQHRCDLVQRLCQTVLIQRKETHQQRLGDLQHQLETTLETAPTSVPVSAEDINQDRDAIKRHLRRIASKTFDATECREWLLGKDAYSPLGLLTFILNKQLNSLDGLAGATTRPTTNAERQEYRRSRDAMVAQRSQLRNEITWLESLRQDFGAVESRILLQIRSWRAFGLQPSPSAPTSVALRMNMPYAKAIAAYRKVRSAFRDETTMTALFSESCVREHGLIDLNLLYERWCVVQVVRAIIGLGFAPDAEEALATVARALVTQRELRTENENLIFTRGAVSLSVKMEPGMKTVEGMGTKYPDLVIRIDGGAQTETVVLDVKCHEFAESLPEGAQRRTTLPSSSNEIRKMYFGPDDGGERNYSMGGQNRVFLLHPCRGGIPKPSSFQTWSAKSFYGERYTYDWQDDDAGPDHRYGAIFLRPGELDDLRRLLGMLLNIATLPQLKGEIESQYQSATRCSQCGGNLDWKKTSTHKGIPKYECTCGSCGEFYVFTHCFLCNRRLVKCGMYWSYHSLAGQIGNVRCPRCGTSLKTQERSNSTDAGPQTWEDQENSPWGFLEQNIQWDEDESIPF